MNDKGTILMPLNGTLVSMETYYRVKRERAAKNDRDIHRRIKRIVGFAVILAVCAAGIWRGWA